MKRANHLMQPIADPENLRLAFWKARKGRSYSTQVQAYRKHLEENLFVLREQILTGLVEVGQYHYLHLFYTQTPKSLGKILFSQLTVDHHRVLIALSAAATGTAIPGTAVLPIATTTARAIATTMLASAWVFPSSSREGRMASTEQMMVRFPTYLRQDKKAALPS